MALIFLYVLFIFTISSFDF